MKFDGPNAVNLVWTTFGMAHVGMAAWVLLLLRVDEHLWKKGKMLASFAAQTDIQWPTLKQLCWAAFGMALFASYHSFFVSPWNNTYKNDERYISSRIATSWDSRDAAGRAEEYYSSQIPHIMEYIEYKFTLHP